MTERTIYQAELISCIRDDREKWNGRADQMIENITETQLCKLHGTDTAKELLLLLEQLIFKQYEITPGNVDFHDLRVEIMPIIFQAITRLKWKYVDLLEGYVQKLEASRPYVDKPTHLVELDSKVKEYGRRIKRLKKSMFNEESN